LGGALSRPLESGGSPPRARTTAACLHVFCCHVSRVVACVRLSCAVLVQEDAPAEAAGKRHIWQSSVALPVTGPDGMMACTCPDTCVAGDPLVLTILGLRFSCNVPDGVVPGDQFRVRIPGDAAARLQQAEDSRAQRVGAQMVAGVRAALDKARARRAKQGGEHGGPVRLPKRTHQDARSGGAARHC
jgi:hypothetical protein